MKKRKSEYVKSREINRRKKRKKALRNRAVLISFLIVLIALIFFGCDAFKNLFNSDEISSQNENSESSIANSSDISSNIMSQSSEESHISNVFESDDFYIPGRLTRYEEYKVRFPEMPLNEIIIIVNMNLDKEFYTNITEVSNPEDLLVICNKYYKVPASFRPVNLVEVPKGYYVEDGKEYLLEERALNAFINMTKAANAEGIKLIIISAYWYNY